MMLSYDKLISDIIYVDGRLSKAKAIGVAISVLTVVNAMIFILPSMLRSSFFIFLGGCIIVFIIALFYYAVCRGIGFVVRRFIN